MGNTQGVNNAKNPIPKANMINEKTSVISKIETGKWVAPNNVIKKLEHLLKINITEG